MQVELTTNRRRWTLFLRRRFVFQLPTTWDECPNRNKLFRMAITDPVAARWHLIRSLVPRRWRLHIPKMEMGSLFVATEWITPQSRCDVLPITSVTIKGKTYVAPGANGTNVCAGEFVVADEQYTAAIAGDATAAQKLTAILYREKEADTRLAARLGDERVRFYHLQETEYAPQFPQEVQAAATLYFSGLKKWVSDVYGPHIFEQPDEDENGNPIHTPDTAPNFGWWGILQTIAESGTFGNMDQVYQANIHEVCIYLVRKKTEADKMKEAVSNSQKSNTHDDIY